MNATRVPAGSLAGLGLLCATALLAGCASTTPDSGGSLTTVTTPPASATSSAPSTRNGASTPPPVVPPPTHTTPAQYPECKQADLTVSATGTDGGSGHRLVVIVFTNSGSRTCSMYGYPGVAALDADGKQVAQATRSRSGYMGGLSGTHLPTVVLQPGHAASAGVEALAFNPSDGSACTAYQGLLVTAPDDTVSTHLPWGNDGCSGLEIHPVVPGTTGDA